MLEPIKLYLKTLTPVHIGTGEELSPLDYIVLGKKYYPVSQEFMVKWIKEWDLSREFSDWMQDGVQKMAETIDNRELAKLRNALTPYEFYAAKAPHKLKAFMDELQVEKGHIEVYFDDLTEQKFQKQTTSVLGQVRAALRTGKNQMPYIPGTTLKGSLRTAVFYHYLLTHGNTDRIKKILKEQLSAKVRKEQLALPLIHEVFYCGTRDSNGRYIDRDEKMDLFKLVSFADTTTLANNEGLELSKFNIYLIAKQRARFGSAPTTVADVQPQALYCESIGVQQNLNTEINFDIDFLLRIKKDIRLDSVGDHWIGIEEKVKKLFNLDLQSINEHNRQEKRNEVIAFLLKCWDDFSKKQHQKQEEWLSHFLKQDHYNRFQGAKAGFEKIKTDQTNYLLHLGYATGFLGTTALLYFLEKDSKIKNELQPIYKQILERYSIGNRPGNRGSYLLDLQNFPKSRRMIEQNKQLFMPGWLMLSLSYLGEQENPSDQVEHFNSSSNEKPVQKEITPSFPKNLPKSGQQTELDAVVIASGRPNKVRVYVRENYLPEMVLQGYRNELPLGEVLIVRAFISKKGDLVQVDYLKVKK